MSSSVRIIIVIMLSVGSMLGFGYFGIRQFTKSIYNERSCEWANIDNIELHTGVDIPAITDSECEFDKLENTKRTMFIINKQKLDMDRYIANNRFVKLENLTHIDFSDILCLMEEDVHFKTSKSLYYTKGEHRGERWQTILDSVTGKLYVTIHYRK